MGMRNFEERGACREKLAHSCLELLRVVIFDV